jgi:nitrogen fixation-related uncharacterized protein
MIACLLLPRQLQGWSCRDFVRATSPVAHEHKPGEYCEACPVVIKMRQDELVWKRVHKGEVDPFVLLHDNHAWYPAWNEESLLRSVKYEGWVMLISCSFMSLWKVRLWCFFWGGTRGEYGDPELDGIMSRPDGGTLRSGKGWEETLPPAQKSGVNHDDFLAMAQCDH